MRTKFLVSAMLCALIACDSSSSDVGANPTDNVAGQGTGGSDTAGQGGSAGQVQGGAGQAQGGAGQGGTGGQIALPIVKSELPRADGSDVSAQDRKTVINDQNTFAFSLYEQLYKDPDNTGKNIFFSPTSITLALGMTASGAQGATLDDLAKAMHFTLPKESLHPALNWFALELAKRPQQAKDFAKTAGANNVPDVTLNVTNAIWGEKTLTWNSPFLDGLAKNYGAGVFLGNFKENAENERLIINDWVSEKTEKRIQDLIPPGGVDDSSRIVLVNAINLTFPWSHPFDAKDTKPAPFTVLGGGTLSVDMMAQQKLGSYAEDDLAQSAALELFSGSLSFVVYLPKEGKFNEFESKLSTEVASLKTAEQFSLIDLKLPKFKFTTQTFSLTKAFENLGAKVPFTPDADFSLMTPSEPLFISQIFHKAMLGVDEIGVQAAAATAVSLAGSGPPPEPTTFHVDRSFLVGIRDNATGALLFLGRILDPNAL